VVEKGVRVLKEGVLLVMNQHHLEWVFLHVGFVRKVDEKSEFSLPWRRDCGNGIRKVHL
jgi:hypothetical protein